MQTTCTLHLINSCIDLYCINSYAPQQIVYCNRKLNTL